MPTPRRAASLLVTTLALALLACQAPQPLARAQEDDAPAETAAQAASEVAVTNHSVNIGGRNIDYTARAGYMPMKADDGEVRANIFHISYTLDAVTDPSQRPVMFVFNGGPGSSSVWLHLGTAGPKRVDMGVDGFMPRPPGSLVDNEHSWFDVTDLVFIDPVGTGYSRPAGEAEQKEFSGLTEDTRSVGDFIRVWLTEHKRWASPKFLAGESYGTTRAASLSGYLQSRHGVYLNGIALISTVLNFQGSRFNTGNDLPYVLFLPTYTATAWFHGALAEDLQSRPLRDVLDEVEQWTLETFMVALAKDASMQSAEREAVARALSRYTGLEPDFVTQNNLRVSIGEFCKELRRTDRVTVGRLDSRFTGVDSDAAGDSFEHDPSMDAIRGPYTAMFNDYVRRELGYENEIVYEILSGRVGRWSYADWENEYVNVADTLREAVSVNPFLKVMVASGYYDLATPFFAADYTFDTMGLEPHLQDNISVRYYEAGHMMYIHEPSLAALKEQVKAFVSDALAPEPE